MQGFSFGLAMDARVNVTYVIMLFPNLPIPVK